MLIVPLVATPSQTLTVRLAEQNCRINVYQKTTGLFLDLYVNDVLVIGGVLGLDRVRMVRGRYLGFAGDLQFFDTQGTTDPTYGDLGARYVLRYLEAADL